MRTVLKNRLGRAVATATAGVIAVMGVATTADAHDWRHYGWRHHNGYGWNGPANRWALNSGYYYNRSWDGWTWRQRYYGAPVYAAPAYRPYYYGAPAYAYYGPEPVGPSLNLTVPLR